MNYSKIVNTTSYSVLVFGVLFFLSGCLSVKPGATKSGKNLFETFFVGEEGTQYFIKPLTFKSDVKAQLILDITFRYKNKIKDSAFVNISFLDKEIIREVDSLKISNDSSVVIFKSLNHLFSERNKKEYNSRFSTKAPLADINQLFNNNNWSITLYKKKCVSKYAALKETKSKIDKLRFKVFSLF